jgi:23S rRNA (adenine2030-N6)-methyltransferase
VNYRHAYHAGNFADVLKHIILVRILEYLKRKPAPFRVIDTHAGAGRYDLGGAEALKTGEWRDGVGRLREADAPPAVAELIEPYLDAVGVRSDAGENPTYPGSPLIALARMRDCDRLVANELRSDDGALLKAALRGARNAKTLALDGYQAVKSLLPPPERRGLILIDPPFENPGEFEQLASALKDGFARFEHGIFAVWYPVKSQSAADQFIAAIAAIAGNSRVRYLDARLAVSAPFPGLGLTECGVLVVNPPFALNGELEILLPWLGDVLATESGGGWRLQLDSD